MSCCCGAGEPATLPTVAAIPQQPPSWPAPQLTPPPSELSFSRQPLPFGCQRFGYRELQGATGNFADNAVLGEGGFGRVYRGTLEDGTPIAIKCLDRLGLQGNKEFNVEVSTLGRLRHPNLVTLRGACTQDQHRLAVFDFMPGGSLRDNLDRHGAPVPAWQAPRAKLLWPARVGIALGAARGLAYLHEETQPGLIHRDVKSSNILLDSLGHARVADFGLAMSTGSASGATAAAYEAHPATDAEMLTGTFGYSAPEYIRDGRMSQKSDVYAFGVILLELLTGREPVDATRPVGMQVLVDELLPILREGNIEILQANLDPAMPLASVPVPQLAAFSEVCLACLQMDPKDRPRTSQLVKWLEAIAAWKDTLPSRPPDNGRHTLLSLMDAVAEVPPMTGGDVLTPVVSHPGTPAHGVPMHGSPLERGSAQAAFQAPGITSAVPPASPSSSYNGPDTWPSMPLTPTGESLPAFQPASPIAMRMADPSYGASHPAFQEPSRATPPRLEAAQASGFPMQAPQPGSWPQPGMPPPPRFGARPMTAPPAQSSTWAPQLRAGAQHSGADGRPSEAWVSFDQPHAAPGRPGHGTAWGTAAADSAHLWTMQPQMQSVVLTPRRAAPPPPGR